MHARVNLATGTVEGVVYVLPDAYAGLSTKALADLTFAGMPGFGLFPVVGGAAPAFNPLAERLGDVVPGAFDRASGTVAGVRPVLKIPAEEIAVRAEALAASVDAERDRRIALGFPYQGKIFQSRPDDFTNLNGASTAAVAAVLNGSQPGDYRWANPDRDFAWIATDNSFVPLDAVGMIALGSAAMANRSRLIFVASAIKARIRAGEAFADVTADALWA